MHVTLKDSPGFGCKATTQAYVDTRSDNQGPAVMCGPVSNNVYRGLFPNTIGSVVVRLDPRHVMAELQ